MVYQNGAPIRGCHDSGGKRWHGDTLDGGLSTDTSSVVCDTGYNNGAWGSGLRTGNAS